MFPESTKLTQVLKERINELTEPLDPVPTALSPRLQQLPSIKAVLFDVYGTMLISGAGEGGTDREMEHGNQVFRNSLHALEVPFHPELKDYNLFQLFIETITSKRQEKKEEEGIDVPEIDIRNIWKTVFQKLASDELVDPELPDDHAFLLKFGMEFELRFNPCWLMPNTLKLLQLLKTNKTLGIISNSQFYTPLSLESLMNSPLDQVGFESSLLYWSYEHGIAKPDLNFYKPAVTLLYERWDIRPHQILYIGNDMLNDIYPAHTLGMHTALFAGDKRSLKLREEDDRLTNLKPSLIITDFLQINNCI